jgi:hypothetical protein
MGRNRWCLRHLSALPEVSIHNSYCVPYCLPHMSVIFVFIFSLPQSTNGTSYHLPQIQTMQHYRIIYQLEGYISQNAISIWAPSAFEPRLTNI